MAKKKATAKPRPEPEMYTIYADILQETEEAILVDCMGTDEIWLPKSQIEYVGERGDLYVAITLPDWLANDKGLADNQGHTPVNHMTQEELAAEAAAEAADQPDSCPLCKWDKSEHCKDCFGEEMFEDAATTPETFTFKADVQNVYDEKYVLLVTNEQGGTASLEFGKGEVSYEGQDVTDLEEGYKDMTFTVAFALAVEKHLPEFLGVTPPAVVAAPAVPEDDPDYREVDEEPKTRPYRQKLRSEILVANIKLTEGELNECAKRITDALEERADMKETAADYSARAKKAEKEAYKAMEVFKSGREERRIHCDVVADYNAGQLVYVESEYPHREIKRLPLTEKDRQLLLPIDEPAVAGSDGDPETTPERSCGTCGHIHAAPEGDEPSPCTDCGQDPDLPNWTDEYHVPVDVHEQQPAAMQ